MNSYPFQWATPDITLRAERIKKELEARDLSRERLLELAAAHKAQGEWLEGLVKSREGDARLHALAFPECCKGVIGFDEYVSASGTRACVSRVQMSFKGCRLAIDPECARFFTVIDVKAGQRSAFVNAMPIAASLFPPLMGKWDNEEQQKAHEQLRFGIPMLHPGGDLTIEVQNRDPANAHVFRAAVWGHYVDR